MTATLTPSYAGRPEPLRWTGEEFDRATTMGLFDGRRVELMHGELLEMPPMNDPHAQVVRLATYALLRVFPPDQATISVQCPMRLGHSRPLPDLVILNGTARSIISHPTTGLLVVEVSDSTLAYDQTDKAALYAAYMIPEYWIIDLNARRVEVRRRPSQTMDLGPRYEELDIYDAHASIFPVAAPAGVDQGQRLVAVSGGGLGVLRRGVEGRGDYGRAKFH